MLTNGLGHFNLLMPIRTVVKTLKLGIVLEEVGLLLALPTTSLNHAYSYIYRFVLQGLAKGQSYLILCPSNSPNN